MAFRAWVERVAKLNERKDAIVADIRNTRKQCQEDGFELVDLNDALKQRKRGDEWVKKRIEAQIRIAQWLGRPLGFQGAFDLGQGAAE